MRYSEHVCVNYQHAVEILAKRWTALILKVLMPGPLRFSKLSEQLDVVSDRVLSERLRELEREGIVERRVLAEIPVRVEYTLTEKGRALSPIIDAIEEWSQQWVKGDPEMMTAAHEIQEAAEA